MSLKRIDKIKRSLVPHVGKRLKIKWQRGYRRDSIVTYDAMLLSLSRHIFILEVIHPKHRERVSFSYADLLSPRVGGVELILKEAG